MEPAYRLPAWWNVFLVTILIIGIVLVCINPLLHQNLTSLVPEFRSEAISRVVGILFISISLSHWCVFYLIQGVDKLFGLVGESTVEDLCPSSLVGVFEGILYPISFIIHQGEFIGLWLAVKVAGQWVRWGTEFPTDESKDGPLELRILEAKRGRRRFNKFLIGNAMRILLAGITYIFLRSTLALE
jgi:hypothetical protein